MPKTRLQPGHFFFLLILALVMFSPELVLAAESFSATQFTPSPDDYSLNVLIKRILGDVVDAEGNVIAAGNLGEIFRAFNTGVAFFGTIIVMFVTVVGTMQTANDGEFLGKRWSSMWVPVRFAGASAMLLPLSASGYSMIQGLILWVATQGIGFADTVWMAAVKNIYSKNQISVVSAIPAEKLVAGVMQSSLCLAMDNQGALERGSATASNTMPTLITKPSPTISFGHYCGKISMRDPKIEASGRSREDVQRVQKAQQEVGAAHFIEMGRITDRFMLLATNYVKNTRIQDNPNPGSPMPDVPDPIAELKKLTDAIITESATYTDAVQSAASRAMSDNADSDGKGVMTQVANKGWVMAGTFYMELSRRHSGIEASISTHPIVGAPNIEMALGSYPTMPSYYQATIGGLLPANSDTEATRNVIETARAKNAGAGGSKVSVTDFSLTGLISSAGSDPGNFSATLSQKISEWVITGIVGVNEKESVVIQLKNKGDYMLAAAAGAVGLEIAGSALSFQTKYAQPISLVGAASAINPLVNVVAGIIDTISKYLLLIGTLLATTGMMLAVYTPMVPYILWLAGVVAWSILLLEALVAGPLWMVMHMSPGGEGISSDKAQQGYMLLLVLFARPALMIMGFIGAIFMIEPLIGFLNDTFFLAMRSTQNSTNSMSGLFVTIGFMVMYVSLVIMVMHKCFAMSHVIPDRVLNWIGGGAQLGEEGADRDAKTMVVGAMGHTTNVMRGAGVGGQLSKGAAKGADAGRAGKAPGGDPGGDSTPGGGGKAGAHLGENNQPNMGNEVAASPGKMKGDAMPESNGDGTSNQSKF